MLLYLINHMKSHSLENRVLLIVHKSVQTSRTQILRNSKSRAVLAGTPLTGFPAALLGAAAGAVRSRESRGCRVAGSRQLLRPAAPRLLLRTPCTSHRCVPCPDRSSLRTAARELRGNTGAARGYTSGTRWYKGAAPSPAQAGHPGDKNQRRELPHVTASPLRSAPECISKSASLTRCKRTSSTSACC